VKNLHLHRYLSYIEQHTPRGVPKVTMALHKGHKVL
jgi:hypothetical protein